jgi:hypothetical protein
LRAQFSSRKSGTWPVLTVSVDYLVVAGGGGGGGARGGGGGAGGYRTSFPGGTKLILEGGSYPITIGGGGSGGPATPATIGIQGSPSIFSTITSAGGGAGLGTAPTPHSPTLGAGGSG